VSERLRRVVVLTHLLAATSEAALRELATARERLGLELAMPADELAKHPSAGELGYQAVDEDGVRAADVCLVFGGDGTILRALGRLLGSGVPTVGVNFGNVGFLAGLPSVGWGDDLAEIVAGQYRLIELLTVDVHHNDTVSTAVNDVVLSRVERRRVLRLEYSISGTRVGEMLCDGMIVATPAGSTAYNLSCNGPLVVWDASVLVLNFIAPHSLDFRPLVLRPDHVIAARNISALDDAEIVVDGSVVGRVCCGDEVSITASQVRARLLVRASGSFYRNIEEKLFTRAPHAR